MERTDQIVKVGPAFELSEHGLSLVEGAELTPEQAQQTTEVLSRIVKSIGYWVGDFARTAEALFHEEASQYLDAAHFDESVLNAFRAVADRVPIENRKLSPSWAHSKTVSKLKPKDQQKWLQMSFEQDWSASKLRDEIQGASTATESVPQFLLVVDCRTEANQSAAKTYLESKGLTVTVRNGMKKKPKVKKLKAAKKEVTAKKRSGAPKPYTRRRKT